jgi:type I restriction enzyme S subunit
MTNKIPTGYKQTEVGIIPKDWTSITMGTIFIFKNGLNKSKEFFGTGISIINYMDVYKFNSIKKDTITGRVNLNKTEIDNYRVKKGDLFFTRTSETVEEVGLCSVLLEESSNTVFSGFVLRGRPKNQLLSREYCKFCFSTNYIRKQIIQRASLTTRALTNGNSLSKVIINFPTNLVEQKAIATNLSDIDNLITSLEELINKKELIKQGAIQELLTGKKKFTGFEDGKWESTKLKNIVIDFIVPMRNKPKKFSGNIPWCRIEDFEGKYLSDSKSQRHVSIQTVNNMNLHICPIGTLLVSCSADLGKCAIIISPLITNQTFIGLVINEDKVSTEFLYYVMKNNSNKLNLLSSGTTISYLSREKFEEFEVIIPVSKKEQQAIAKILSDMDLEIEALETKLGKYKQIKQGMMQNLLTGKIRLV